MRELEIVITGLKKMGETVVEIDNKPTKFTKNDFGSLTCKYQTENNNVNIKVYRMLDVGGFVWFITQLFFFVVSIFGIFDVHKKEKCLVVQFEAEFELKEENKLTLQFNTLQANAQAINVKTDLTTRELLNNYYLDVKSKRTLTILTFSKLFLVLASIVLAVVAFMMQL